MAPLKKENEKMLSFEELDILSGRFEVYPEALKSWKKLILAYPEALRS
jgi:hypothetical protein